MARGMLDQHLGVQAPLTHTLQYNPCEMVFGFVKNSLRTSRNSENTFFDEVNERFHAISHDGMERFFMHWRRSVIGPENEIYDFYDGNEKYDFCIKRW